MAKATNLDSMSVEELSELIKEAEAKREEKLEGAKKAFVQEMASRAAAMGMSLEGLLSGQKKASAGSGEKTRKARRDAGKPVAVKFRGPGGEQWSGRGRPPTWLVNLEAGGKNREDFRV